MSRWSAGQDMKVEVNGKTMTAESVFFDKCPFLTKDETGDNFCLDESGGTVCRKSHCRLRMMADEIQSVESDAQV